MVLRALYCLLGHGVFVENCNNNQNNAQATKTPCVLNFDAANMKQYYESRTRCSPNGNKERERSK